MQISLEFSHSRLVPFFGILRIIPLFYISAATSRESRNSSAKKPLPCLNALNTVVISLLFGRAMTPHFIHKRWNFTTFYRLKTVMYCIRNLPLTSLTRTNKISDTLVIASWPDELWWNHEKNSRHSICEVSSFCFPDLFLATKASMN